MSYDSATIISLIGILLGVAVFIGLAFREVNLTLAALLASLVMFAISGANVVDGIINTWVGGVTGALKSFLLMFIMGGLYGKVMDVGGGAKRIALSLVALLMKAPEKYRKFLSGYSLVLFYFIFTYIGIHGFIIVFTVLAIGRELYKQQNIPWSFYCYGSGGVLPGYILAGGLSTINAAAITVSKTTAIAGFGISLVMIIVYFIVHANIFMADLRKAEKNGWGFLPQGEEIMKVNLEKVEDDGTLPSLISAVIPIVVMIVMAAGFNINIVVALATGTILSFLLFWPQLKSKNIRTMFNSGVISVLPPVINVCAASAMATVIKGLVGFKIVTGALDTFSPMVSAVGLGMLVALVVGSSTSSIPSFGPTIFEKFTSEGLSAATSTRLMILSTSVTSIPPHNPGVVNASSVARIEFRKAAWIYFKGSCFPAFGALIVTLILIQVGLFV